MTLYSLGKHFLGHHRPAPSSVATNPVAAPAGAVDTYPVVVFHPASLGDDIKATLRASVAAGLRAANATDEGGAPVRNADLRLVTIDIGVPAWMKATLTPAQLESYSYTCAPFPPCAASLISRSSSLLRPRRLVAVGPSAMYISSSSAHRRSVSALA